jgi:cell wall-associated NlpC family hydrolase
VHRRYCRYLVLLACAGAVVLLAPAAVARRSAPSWAEPQIRTVVEHGLMATSVAAFKPSSPLTRPELDELLPALPLAGDEPETTDPTTGETEPDEPTDTTTTPEGPPPGSPKPGAAVKLSEFDAALVDQLGLSDAAARFRRAARLAGLAVPARFGTETVARLLGLRINHPGGQDSLELLPSDKISRAETAYSIARLLSFQGGEADWVDGVSSQLVLPSLNDWQKRILSYATSFIGYPYVWGGTSPKRQLLFGRTVPGGFDCSGFVWRVYKLHSYPGGDRLAATIRGRTTYEMSGEVPRPQRIPFEALQPGDVLFFGAAGPRSKPAQINHTAIYLGSGWLIQSSGQGVALSPLEGWYRSRFAWARRPLAEAGLVNVFAAESP